jgi:hypothetical protein
LVGNPELALERVVGHPDAIGFFPVCPWLARDARR